MPYQPEPQPKVGYVVSTWPRLSQTFVLNEILALERRGLPLRVFSTKSPRAEPVHAKVRKVRAPITYLNVRRRVGPILSANLRTARAAPARYLRALAHALRFGRPDVLWRFVQAGYLADLIRREGITHLHAHFTTAPTLVAMFTHQLARVPYTFTAHARDIFADTSPELLQVEMDNARAVVTVSDYNERYLCKLKPDLNGKLRRINYGVDLSEFKFRGTRRSGPQPPIILAVARLVEKKGLRDLLLSAELLREQGLPFRVQIIGEGEQRKVLEALIADRNLQDCVILMGAQPHEEVILAYDRACVFVLPCVVASDGDRDGLPNVLLEAMASGIPVVSTAVAGIPELIESECDGLLVPAGDPVALSGALKRLLADPELRERLAANARVKVEEKFSIDHSAENLMDLFASCAR